MKIEIERYSPYYSDHDAICITFLEWNQKENWRKKALQSETKVSSICFMFKHCYFDKPYLIRQISECCEKPRLQKERLNARRPPSKYHINVTNFEINVIANWTDFMLQNTSYCKRLLYLSLIPRSNIHQNNYLKDEI